MSYSSSLDILYTELCGVPMISTREWYVSLGMLVVVR